MFSLFDLQRIKTFNLLYFRATLSPVPHNEYIERASELRSVLNVQGASYERGLVEVQRVEVVDFSVQKFGSVLWFGMYATHRHETLTKYHVNMLGSVTSHRDSRVFPYSCAELQSLQEVAVRPKNVFDY